MKSLLSLREMFSTTPPISQDQIDQLYLHSTPSTRETLKRFETYIPSSSVAQALFLKESGSRFVEKTYMDLCQVLKQRPTPETVGVLYARYEQVKNLPSVFALQGKTKIAPEFSQEQLSAWVQFLFQEALQPITRLRGLLDLRQLGPITLSEEQLLSLYETLLEDKQSLVFVSGAASGTPLQGAVRAFGAQHPEVLRSMCHKHMNTKTLSVDDVFYLSRVANVSQLFKGGEHRRYLLEQAFRDGDVTRLRHMETVLGEPLDISSAEAQKWYTMIFLRPSQFSQENYWFIRNRSKTPPSVEIVDARYRAIWDRGSLEPLKELAGIVETRPSQETIQSIFQEAFTQYLRAYDSNYSEDGELYEDFGDVYYKEYVDFVRCVHMEPVYTEAFAHESYQYCLAQGKSHAGKLSVIERETGVVLDEANIKAFLFDDKQIDVPCLEQIPLSMMEEHFAEPDNRSLIEYQRVYKVTGAYDYYQSVLEEYASGVAGRGPSEYARLLLTLLTVEQRRRDRFEPLFGRLMEVLKRLSGKIDASLKEGLESLMRSNLEKFQGEFLQWLHETTTPSKQSEVVQTLMQLEGYAVKFALYAWANTSDAQEMLKQEIVTFLMTQNFFSEDIASWLRRQRETEGEKTNVWGVLSAHASLEDIRNKSLKEQAYCLMDPLFARPGNELASDVNSLQDSFSSIPSHALLPLLAAFGKDERMLSLIDQSYQQQKQERVREKRLAQTLAYAKLPRQIQNLLQDSFHQRWSGESVDEFLGLATKLDILLHLSAPEQEMSDESISDEEKITRIDLFAQKIASAESVRDLDQWLSDKQWEHFHHTFPSQSFSHEQIGLLVERFQGMEQLLGYAKKLKRLDSQRVIQHFGEMLSAMDSTERWQDWRYDETNPLVNAQLAPLSKEQRLLWKEEICVDQGDVSIANDLLDRPALIAERLEQGWSQGHLYHPDLSPAERHRWIQEQLAIHSTNLQLPTVDRSSYVRGAIEEIQHQKETIGLFLRLQELSKIQSLIVDCERLEQEPTKQGSGPPTIAASRLKNLSDLLHSILPEEVFQRVMGQRMLDVSVRQQLSEQIQVLHQQAEAGFSADEFSRLGISIEQTKQPGILYKKQKELTALSQLLQLTQLTQRQIAQGYVSGIARKQGMSIEMQFDTLSQYFSDAPSFVQDIQNAKQVLGERERTSASKRRLAVLVTDDPFMMFQIGRYPHGVTSCQSHEGDFRLNRALLAYMGDAHIKGVFVIDLDQLPDEAQAMIEEQGMQALRQYTRSIDLLEASVARSVVKLVQDANKIQPALFIEPSYSAFGKSDGVIDHLITQTIKGTLSKTLRASTMRYGGTEMVQVPTSRNPQGQYEDAQAFHGGHGMGIQFGSYTMPAHVDT